jgi:hypothetical protein
MQEKAKLNWHVVAFLVLIGMILILWLLTPLALAFVSRTVGFDTITMKPYFEAAGQFGDSFGVFSSLITALSILGLVYTLRQQHKDAIEAKKDAEEQKELLKRQLEVARLDENRRVCMGMINEALDGLHGFKYAYSHSEIVSSGDFAFYKLLNIKRDKMKFKDDSNDFCYYAYKYLAILKLATSKSDGDDVLMEYIVAKMPKRLMDLMNNISIINDDYDYAQMCIKEFKEIKEWTWRHQMTLI